MNLTAKEVFNRFYDEVAKDKYPQYNKAQITLVCYTPFRYLRMAIRSCTMPIVRFKYIGEFEPNVFKIANFLKNIDRIKATGKVSHWWLEMIKRDCERLMDKKICELHDSYINERGLVRYNVDEVEFKRLLKIYIYDKNEE